MKIATRLWQFQDRVGHHLTGAVEGDLASAPGSHNGHSSRLQKGCWGGQVGQIPPPPKSDDGKVFEKQELVVRRIALAQLDKALLKPLSRSVVEKFKALQLAAAQMALSGKLCSVALTFAMKRSAVAPSMMR